MEFRVSEKGTNNEIEKNIAKITTFLFFVKMFGEYSLSSSNTRTVWKKPVFSYIDITQMTVV